jgi:hypothetical protein
VALSEDLARIAALAGAYAEDDEELAGVLATEPRAGVRAYLCAFASEAGRRSWLTLDADGQPFVERPAVRDAVSIAGLCEVAVESAGGGDDLGELRSRLLALRVSEDPPGIEEAEEAALELERTIGAPPHLATPAFLDEVGSAARRLERALGQNGFSPFAEAMQQAMAAVEALTVEVERGYKRELRS